MQYFITILGCWLCGLQVLLAQPVDHCSYAKHLHAQVVTQANALPATIDLQTVQMDLTINPVSGLLQGKVDYVAVAKQTITELPIELRTQLTVTMAEVDGQSVDFQQEAPYGLLLNLTTALSAGDTFSFFIAYAGTPTSTGFGSVGQAVVEEDSLWWTLSQPYGARDWWPIVERLQDKIDTTTITIRTPLKYRGVANGILLSDQVTGTIRTTTYRHAYPVSPYLIAVAVAPFTLMADTIALQAGNLPINNHILTSEVTTAGAEFDRFYKAFQYLDSLFTPYPFMTEQYGHARIGWPGGMEHQTISFVGSYGYELLVHEVAHQWFGDWVTCGSWQDLWLNEGFATYLSGLAYERYYRDLYWQLFLQVREERILAEPDGSVFRADTTDVRTLFTSRLTYFKAAWVLHQLRWVLGDKAFFAGCRGYLNDPTLVGGYARTPDLQRHMEQASGRPLTAFFADWVYGEGHPSYRVEWVQDNSRLFLTVSQTTSHRSVPLFEMPVPLRLVGENRDTLVVVDLQRNIQSYTILWDQQVKDVQFDPDNWLLGEGLVTQLPEAANPLVVMLVGDGQYRVASRYSNVPFAALQVYATNGQMVYSAGTPADGWVDLSGQPKGIYILVAHTATQQWMQQVLR